MAIRACLMLWVILPRSLIGLMTPDGICSCFYQLMRTRKTDTIEILLFEFNIGWSCTLSEIIKVYFIKSVKASVSIYTTYFNIL
jgi:hypothetical protein